MTQEQAERIAEILCLIAILLPTAAVLWVEYDKTHRKP